MRELFGFVFAIGFSLFLIVLGYLLLGGDTGADSKGWISDEERFGLKSYYKAMGFRSFDSPSLGGATGNWKKSKKSNGKG